jgi:hypothetical protein
VNGARALRTALRTAHLLAFGALYGGQVYGVDAERLAPALTLTAATGMALLLLDVVREPVTLVQVRGVASLVKIGLALAFAFAASQRLTLLTVAAVVGAASSHMPGRYRYYSLLHRRVVGSQEKG